MSLERNKKLARKHIDLTWNRGHMALAEQLHSKDFLYKSSFVGRPLGSGEFLAMVEQIRTAMPDLEVVIEECLAEADKVVTWSTLIGTIQKSALGYSPSDKVLSISAMAFWTLTPTGQIREICTMFDMESFRAQLGLDTRPYAEKALP
ncbi:ketosteroid isomerase-related protein [Stutzerimonas nitrititolerans]|uniref:ketosteroid isomerase-related protein n=1 Tax=Stutzerimonas nitrititolerans TaxID=2482751 RepID=UPI0028B04E22|nr:ketosteroid isomerase-related protein [Stutzerimonas nitrititolerans]